jgi:hypothetical protein
VMIGERQGVSLGAAGDANRQEGRRADRMNVWQAVGVAGR